MRLLKDKAPRNSPEGLDRQTVIRTLMHHPQYFQLRFEGRLNIVRRDQNGLPLSLMLLLLIAHHWV
jgi:hypothetical protein